MSTLTLANRYASTLKQAAESKGSLDTIFEQSKVLSDMIATNEQLKLFLVNPVITTDEKINILGKALASVEPLLKDFMVLLCKKKRANLSEEILEQFQNLYLESKNIREATVVSAIELSAEQLEKIKSYLKTKLSCEISLSTEQDSTIMGGYLIKLGDEIIDNSITNRLNFIEKALLAAG